MAELCSMCTRHAEGVCARCGENLCGYHRRHEGNGRFYRDVDEWTGANIPQEWVLPESWQAAQGAIKDGSQIMHLDCRAQLALAGGQRVEDDAPQHARTWLLRGQLTPAHVAARLRAQRTPMDCRQVGTISATPRRWPRRTGPDVEFVMEQYWLIEAHTAPGSYSGGVEPGRSGHYGGWASGPAAGHALTEHGDVVAFRGEPDRISRIEAAHPLVIRSSNQGFDTLLVADYVDALAELATRAGARPPRLY